MAGSESKLPFMSNSDHGFSEVVAVEVVKSNYFLENWIGKTNLDPVHGKGAWNSNKILKE